MARFLAARLPLPAADEQPGATFGAAVATDGHQVLVGAPAQDLRGLLRRRADAGRAWLFQGAGLDWEVVQTLDAGSRAQAHAAFGQAVSIDGDTLVVGAPLARSEQTALAGVALVYERMPDRPERGFVATAVLEGAREGELGSAVSTNRRTVAVGAPYERVGVERLHPAAGAVHLYDRPPVQRAGGRVAHPDAEGHPRGEGDWTRGPTLLSPLPGLASGTYGAHVALSGTHLVVGEEWSVSTREVARVYRLEAQGCVDEAVLYAAPELGERVEAGARAVALDGELVAVGLPTVHHDGAREVGAVQLYRRTGQRWHLVAVLEAPVDERREDLRYGHAVALADGLLVVGAPGWSDGQRTPGAVYLYTPAGEGWALAHRYVPTFHGTGDDAVPARFGAAVAARGGVVVVGAPGWDVGGAAEQLAPAGTPGPSVAGAGVGDRADAGAAWVLTLAR